MKSGIYGLCSIFLSALTFFSCDQTTDLELPLIVTGVASEIDSSGVTFSAKILGDVRGDGLKYGFVWGVDEYPTIDGSDKYIVHDVPDKGVISRRVTTTFIEGVRYNVRAFLQDGDNISYGRAVSFISLGSKAPKITDFAPEIANIGDTIRITGDNFSCIGDKNVVYFGKSLSMIIKATQDTLWAIVPEKLKEFPAEITVSILNNISSCPKKFDVIFPEFTDFNPKTGAFRSIITITGKDFLKTRKTPQVYFDRYKAVVTQTGNESLQVIVPDSLDKKSSFITVKVNNKNYVFTSSFNLDRVIISDFSPRTAKTGSTITLTGSNFSPLASNNSVTIGGLKANVISAGMNELKVVLPSQNVGYYHSRNASVSVIVAEEKQVYTNHLIIDDAWFRLKNIPDNVLTALGIMPACFSVNDKGYVGLHSNNVFWEYDPAYQSWRRVADFPGKSRSAATGFAIGKNIYFGTGYANLTDSISGQWGFSDWWKFDTENNTWIRLKEITPGIRYGSVAFTVNNVGYLGTGKNGGYLSDIWKYNLSGDSWTKVTDYIFSGTQKEGMYRGVAVATSNAAFIGLGSTNNQIPNIFKYTPSTNTWKQLPAFPEAGYECYPQGFCLNDRAYIKSYFATGFYFYNESTSKWVKEVADQKSFKETSIIFTIGNKAYIGLPSTAYMWEFDPGR